MSRLFPIDAQVKWYAGTGTGGTGGISTATTFPVFSANPVTSQDINDIFPISNSVLVCTSNGLFLSGDFGNTFLGPLSNIEEFPVSQCNRIKFAQVNTRL